MNHKSIWSKPRSIERPTAKVNKVQDGKCFIACPYCSQEHAHQVLELGHLEARAAACDLWYPIDPKVRVIGYEFTTPKGKVSK